MSARVHHGAGVTVKVIADSLAANGKRLITICARYQRFIHSEVMTHRAFGRNAASSRAQPVRKVLKQVWSDPAMPIYWGSNKPGMQAGKEITGWRLRVAKIAWRTAAKIACVFAWTMMKLGLHKQVANRVLEPFQWMETIITATEWENFFHLRISPAAQPEICDLASTILAAIQASTPEPCVEGDAHLPYLRASERVQLDKHTALMVSAARCARVSYLNHDGTAPNVEKDLVLARKLASSGHWSPFEHPACAAAENQGHVAFAHLRGWIAQRYYLQDYNNPLSESESLEESPS